MSDEIDEESEPRKGKKRDPESVVAEAIPKDRALFDWLEELFYGDPEASHYPEILDVRPVFGSKSRDLGDFIWRKIFAPSTIGEEALKRSPGKSRKPTQAQLVIITNLIVNNMQRDCDERRRPQKYGVHAWQMTTDSDPVARYLKHMEPQRKYRKEGEVDGVEDDEEGLPAEKKFGKAILSHGERMFEAYLTAFAGLLDRYDRDKERDSAEIERLHKRLDEKGDQLERALSLELDREERRMWSALKVKSVEKGLDFGAAMLPPVVNSLMGKQILPTNDTPETITLKNFLKSMNDEQSQAAFGVYDGTPANNLVTAGALTKAQAEIIHGVAEGGLRPDDLDKLMPGQSCAISMDQVMKLQQIFSMEQLAPIMLIFEARRKKVNGS